MSIEVLHVRGKEHNEAACGSSGGTNRSKRCVDILLNMKDRKILVSAYGVFMVTLGIALAVGYVAIRRTTTSTVHTETPIPTVVTSALVILSGTLFVSLVFHKPRYLITTIILSSTISGIISAIGTVHYGMAVAKLLTALSGCFYRTVQRSCTCSVESQTSKVWYKFENTGSCKHITTHLREVVYGMCGVYAVTFLACFSAAVYGILLLHKIEIRKIKSEQRQMEITEEPLPEKQDFEEFTPEILPGASKKWDEPWQHDVATQTTDHQPIGKESSCRHHCRHFVGVKVPSTRKDYVVNMTNSRDPPPPYCETVYT